MRSTVVCFFVLTFWTFQARATQFNLPFACEKQPRVTVGSGFHRDYEIDWNIGSGNDDAGEDVVAMASGTVKSVSYMTCGYGYNIELDHGNGETTFYAHLEEGVDVKQGDAVARGERIARVGATGQCPEKGMTWSSHLHTEYRVNGIRQPPYIIEAGGYVYGTNPAYDGAVYTSMNCGGPDPSVVTFLRAYPHGGGTANGLAWVQGVKEAGDIPVLGLAVEPPHWQNNFVVQQSCRPNDGVCNLIIHDERAYAPRALPLIDAFAKAFQQFGGFATFDAPLSRKYQLSSGAWRQDFWRGYIVLDASGAHQYRYPYGVEPGEGAVYKAPFRVAYGELGGDNGIGNPNKGVQNTGGYEWQEYQNRSGIVSRLYSTPDALRAYWVQGKILTWYKANDTVFRAGPPISDAVALSDGGRKQYFRYGVITEASSGITFVKSSTQQYGPGDAVAKSQGVLLRDAYERNGGAKRLGACAAPVVSSSFVTQYCTGGEAVGRALVVLNVAEHATMAFVVFGGIESAYAKSGGLTGSWGFPISDRYDAGLGQQQAFQRVSVDWYNNVVHVDDWVDAAPGEGSGFATAFRYLWQLDLSRSGQPRTLARWWQYKPETAVVQEFEGGDYHTPVSFIHDEMGRAPRAFLLRGGMRNAYFDHGGPTGSLGLPVSDIIVSGKYATQYFEHGYLAGNTDVADYDLHLY